MLTTMKKMNRDSYNIPEQNNGHVSESNQRPAGRVSFDKLKRQVVRAWGTHSDIIDVADYAKLTVRTDFGVYQAGDCGKHHADSEKSDHSSTAKLYGAECRFEGHVCDIKGFLDANEDALHLSVIERKE